MSGIQTPPPACLPAFLSPLSESLEQVNKLLHTAFGIEDDYVDVHLLVLIFNA